MSIWRPWVRCGMWIPAAASHRKHCTAYCACWGVTDLPVHLRGYVEALGAGIPVRPDDLLLRHAFERLLTKERCMLLWGQSVPAALPPFPQKSAVICGKELVKGIARLLASEHEIVVASDHGTDPESGAHLGGPQPFFTSR